LRRCAQAESKVEMDVQAGFFTQAEFCQVSGLSSVTVGAISVLAIFEAKVTGELVTRLSLPPSEASEVARCAADWIRPMIGNPGSSRQSKEQRSSPLF
jgi:hypothetical protein